MRNLNMIDQILMECQHLLKNVCGRPVAKRESPGKIRMEQPLDASEKRQSQGFMRVNHTGEICAQALYRGQAFSTNNAKLKAYLYEAAAEETDHLAWCRERLEELGTQQSRLNFLWYTASFLTGYFTAKSSDSTSLGFVEETEKQVVAHLERHAKLLSPQDQKSRAIIAVMQEDENNHGKAARAEGATDLPHVIKCTMKLQAKVMTTTAYYL